MGRCDEEVVLGDPHGDARDVTLLEGVGTDIGRRDLTGNDHERRRVHVSVSDGGHDVRRAGTTGHHGDSGSSGSHRVALGHVASTLFVAHEDVAN